MKVKREEKAKIKKDFVDSGNADKMIDNIHKQMKQTIDINDLPF